MPKPTNLSDIFSLLQNKAAVEKDHFLFLLGTDTVFTRRPTISLQDSVQKKSYERGEWLSYSAQAVVTLLDEQGSVEFGEEGAPLSYSSLSVDVVNGPTTLGTEVGDRVAQAVFLALRAVACGKETLQIAAHSRGAVEAIVVMSELARIKKALKEQPNLSLYEILCEVPKDLKDTTNLAAAMEKMFQKDVGNETPALRKQLLASLERLTINPFLHDPVPGGSRFGLKAIRWHSRRFYEKPACNDYHLSLCRDERTRCFTPIVPMGMEPVLLPGHHGTASGNRYNQQYLEVSQRFENRNTTTVQDLILCKLFYFFNRCTKGRFKQEKWKRLELEHVELDKVLNDFLGASESARHEQIVAHYSAVKKNDSAYRSFADGSYAYLGTQYTKEKQRYVHYHGRRHQSMDAVVPPFDEGFVNQEHARYQLHKYIRFDELADAPVDVMIREITVTLRDAIDEMLQSEKIMVFSVNLDSTPASSSRNSNSLELANVLKTEEGSKLFFNALAVVVDMISQKYLRGNLTKDEDIRFREVIEQPFQMLREAQVKASSENSKHQGVIKECDDLIQGGLKRATETHYNSIVQQTDAVIVQISHSLATEESFGAVFTDFIAKLSGDTNAPAEFDQVLSALRRTNSNTIRSIEAIQQAIDASVLGSSEAGERHEAIKAYIAGKEAELLQPFFDAYQTSADDYLINLERLYKLASTLSNDYPSLQMLVSTKKIEIDLDQLHFRRLALIKAGGDLLKGKRFILGAKPNCISEEFFNLIKQEAIKQGMPSPEYQELRRQMDQLTAQAQQKQSEIELIQREKDTQNQQNTALRQQCESLKKLSTDKDALISKLQSAEEVRNAALLQDKLLPLTSEYLAYLLEEIQKIHPDIPVNDDGSLPLVLVANESEKVDFDKAANKYNLVLRLQGILEDTENYPLPSVRAEIFKEALQSAGDLKIHRDAPWLRYTRTCFAILGIIVIGIVPAIAAMVVYSALGGKKNPLFFNHYTRGDAFIAECKDELGSIESQTVPA